MNRPRNILVVNVLVNFENENPTEEEEKKNNNTIIPFASNIWYSVYFYFSENENIFIVDFYCS